MPEQTPYEKLKKSNDGFHEAVNEIMMDEQVNANLKAQFGAACLNVFNGMEDTLQVIKAHYEEE